MTSPTTTLAAEIIEVLRQREEFGMTSKEAQQLFDHTYHGPISGSLSLLHRSGEIHRLTEMRDGRKVYVLPRFCKGRTIERQGRLHQCPECGAEF